MKNKFVTLCTVVGAVSLFISNSVSAKNQSYDLRHNACRTFHTFSFQKEFDKFQEIDGVFCVKGNSLAINQKVEKDIPVILSTKELFPPVVVITKTPAPENTPKVKPLLPTETPQVKEISEEDCDTDNTKK